jgi:hypothetical protein
VPLSAYGAFCFFCFDAENDSSVVAAVRRNEPEILNVSTSNPVQVQPEHWERQSRAIKEGKLPYGLTKLCELKRDGRIRHRKIDGIALIELNSARNPDPK